MVVPLTILIVFGVATLVSGCTVYGHEGGEGGHGHVVFQPVPEVVVVPPAVIVGPVIKGGEGGEGN